MSIQLGSLIQPVPKPQQTCNDFASGMRSNSINNAGGAIAQFEELSAKYLAELQEVVAVLEVRLALVSVQEERKEEQAQAHQGIPEPSLGVYLVDLHNMILAMIGYSTKRVQTMIDRLVI